MRQRKIGSKSLKCHPTWCPTSFELNNRAQFQSSKKLVFWYSCLLWLVWLLFDIGRPFLRILVLWLLFHEVGYFLVIFGYFKDTLASVAIYENKWRFWLLFIKLSIFHSLATLAILWFLGSTCTLPMEKKWDLHSHRHIVSKSWEGPAKTAENIVKMRLLWPQICQ